MNAQYCTCGHKKSEHIYHEGPCRPGFKCESECKAYKPLFSPQQFNSSLQEGQKKSHSFAEAIFNVIVGFGINMTANMIVLPWFGFPVSLKSAFGIGVIFTGISIVRSYVLRRVFNRITIKEAMA